MKKKPRVERFMDWALKNPIRALLTWLISSVIALSLLLVAIPLLIRWVMK